MKFIELHARSAFSFLRGASLPEDLVAKAADLDMSHIAITDRDGFYGSARAHYRAKERGVQAIVGCELTMADDTVQPVLVRTREGYQNLCHLITISKLRAPKGQSRIEWSELEAHAEGLIALTGDEESPLHRALKQDRKAAPQLLEQLVRTFGKGQVYVELQRHHLRGETLRNQQLVELAERAGLPLIASNGAAYATPDRRMLLDAFTSLRHHTHLDEAGLLLETNSQRYLKSGERMKELFADLPQAVEETLRVAERIDYSLSDLGYEFPEYAVPGNHDQATFLREQTLSGAHRHFGSSLPKKVAEQINTELKLITKLGFSGYFLIVWDIVKYAREQGILIQGRGSAANSVVCFCLDITKVNPMKHKMMFERFLSEGRGSSWPDIDLDLPSGDRRESVIQEVYRRFAPYGAAMTANVIRYRGRSAMREMGKVLNLPEDVLSRFSSMYPHGDYAHTMKLDDQLRQAGVSSHHPRLLALVHLLQQVRGLPRHLSQHSGGMVLCSKGLDRIVPLEPATMPKRTVVQWDKDDCEDMGIIKVDLLGLGMMAAIEDTLALSARRGRPVDLSKVADEEDAETFAMMQKADTIGVFQIESRAQMATLPRLKPRTFYDVVIEVAIIRPGPIVGKMVHPYLNRRSGKEKVHYIHDALEPMLKEVLDRTLGVPLFQEQILEMAMKIADFSGSEAEELRRAMSFHRSQERMDKVMKELRAGMGRKGLGVEVQDRVVQAIRSFALYGFPESHAISFALLAYASVWLKVHRAAEFYTALLNNYPLGFYSRATLIRDARAHRLKVKPVCVVQSEFECTVESDHTLRLGLGQLQGINRKALQALVAERQRCPWQDLPDLLQRCKLNKDERRVLAKSGALNALKQHRRSALWQVESVREPDLFSTFAILPSPLAMMEPVERLEADYQSAGVTTGPHPMAYVRDQVPQVRRACDLADCKDGQQVCIAGQVICRQRPGTAKGHVFVSLEDETGIANAFVHCKLFEKLRLVITQEPFLRIHGRLQNVDNVISVYALHVEALHFDAALDSESHDFH